MTWAVLDPALPKWDDVRHSLRAAKWVVGREMQAYARPDRTKRSLAYNATTCKREPRPNPAKGQSQEEKPTRGSTVKLKRGPGAATDELKAKKGNAPNAIKSTPAEEAKDVDMTSEKEKVDDLDVKAPQ